MMVKMVMEMEMIIIILILVKVQVDIRNVQGELEEKMSRFITIMLDSYTIQYHNHTWIHRRKRKRKRNP